MGFNKLFNKSLGQSSRFFNKVGDQTQNAFNKVNNTIVKPISTFVNKNGSAVLGDVSKGLGQAGGILGSIASNPLITATLGPQANLLAGAGSALTSGLSNLTKQKNYSGNANQVSQQILNGARDTQASFNNSLEKKIPQQANNSPVVAFH